MARAALTLQSTTRSGLTASYSAATVDGFAFDNEKHDVILHVKNGGAVSLTVTIQIPGNVDGEALPDKTVTINAGADKFIGPFPELYNQNSAIPDIDKAVYVDFSVQTSVTVAALKVGSLSY
jgi:hypothetical protein